MPGHDAFTTSCGCMHGPPSNLGYDANIIDCLDKGAAMICACESKKDDGIHTRNA